MRRFVYLALLVAAVFVPAASPAGAPGLPGKIAFSAEGGSGVPEIFAFRAGGGGLRSLTKNVDCRLAYQPVWSRDGSLLAVLCVGRARRNRLCVMWQDGSHFRCVPHIEPFGRISFSPDRRQVAFLGRDGIDVANISSGRKRRVVRNSGGASWSPDGKKLLFVREAGTRRPGIWVIGVDGHGLRRLTSRITFASPEWSPDGRRIAFNAIVGTSVGLFVMNANGSGAHRIFTRAACCEPVWSPDSRWIATTSNNNVYVFPVDRGQPVRKIAHGQKLEIPLTWAP